MPESIPIRNKRTAARVAFVLGTRPEAIKLAPIILRMRRRGARLAPVIISTGQQADLVAPSLDAFGLRADVDLCVMRRGQSLARLTARCLSRLSDAFRDLRPRLVVVQGDTASTLAGAMAAFFEKLPVAHVEAGLRTGDLAAPFPEEANRQLISRIARLHFAPTLDAKANLLAEGIDPASIEVTGNTVVDALELLRPRIAETALPAELARDWSPPRKLVLVTAHRRENVGPPLESICSAIAQLAATQPELHFAFITHPNPHAGRVAREHLFREPRVTLLAPQSYLATLRLVAESWLVLTDSGGLQEEAPSFRRPVLVLRDRTERTEGVTAGVATLVGADAERIRSAVLNHLNSSHEFNASGSPANPYGDGHAAERAVRSLTQFTRLESQSGLRFRMASTS